ncbi:MAG: hypothetical protein ACFFCW_09915 [Candidatus Hodarchaeota archaeon]
MGPPQTLDMGVNDTGGQERDVGSEATYFSWRTGLLGILRDIIGPIKETAFSHAPPPLFQLSVEKWRSGVEKGWQRSDNIEEHIYEGAWK